MAPKKYITIGEYCLIGLGCLFLVIAVIVGARHQRKRAREEPVYEKVGRLRFCLFQVINEKTIP